MPVLNISRLVVDTLLDKLFKVRFPGKNYCVVYASRSKLRLFERFDRLNKLIEDIPGDGTYSHHPAFTLLNFGRENMRICKTRDNSMPREDRNDVVIGSMHELARVAGCSEVASDEEIVADMEIMLPL